MCESACEPIEWPDGQRPNGPSPDQHLLAVAKLECDAAQALLTAAIAASRVQGVRLAGVLSEWCAAEGPQVTKDSAGQ